MEAYTASQATQLIKKFSKVYYHVCYQILFSQSHLQNPYTKIHLYPVLPPLPNFQSGLSSEIFKPKFCKNFLFLLCDELHKSSF
jgi:hypothetical protein